MNTTPPHRALHRIGKLVHTLTCTTLPTELGQSKLPHLNPQWAHNSKMVYWICHLLMPASLAKAA